MKNRTENGAFRERYIGDSCIYTDLAAETREVLLEDNEDEEIRGVKYTLEQDDEYDIKLSWIEVLDEQGQKAMGKPVGNYIAIESDCLKENDIDAHEKVIEMLAEKIGQLHNLDRHGTVLVIGLGNWNVTPDALGPKVVSKILVTRHIKESIPEALEYNVRSVSALSPGVMGITGIETKETVKGLVERTQPDLVIAIDALASRSASRVNGTIQLSDTGISPGAGMGNKRKLLNQETLGVPVMAIGVPTVVDAATLINDSLDKMLDEMIKASEEGSGFYQMLQNLGTEEKYALITELLDPYAGNMFVTPKEVDAVIERLSNIIANAINIALHPGITREDINRYMY